MDQTRSFTDEDTCTKCGRMVDTLTAVDEGVFVCEDCLDDYLQCDCCGEWYEDIYMTFSYDEASGRLLCSYCAEEELQEEE